MTWLLLVMQRTQQILCLLIYFTFSSCGTFDSHSQDNGKGPKVSVGTKDYIWEDKQRIDDYYGGTRILNVRVWYLTDVSSKDSIQTSYLLFAERLRNQIEGWTESDIDAAQNVKLHSFQDAPIKEEIQKAPLLIFSPSLGGNLSYYTYFGESFAKQGYIVMGINHLHESEVVVDDRGLAYPANHTFHDSLKTIKIPEEITAEKYREVKGVRTKVLAEDIKFALSQLLDNTDFSNKIDRNKIGVFGHSIGGATAVYSAMIDDRIKVVINMDGTPPSNALEYGIEVPFLFLEDLTDYRNHQGYAKQYQRRSDFCQLNKEDSWRILIDNINHQSFMDIDYYFAEDAKSASAVKAQLDMILEYMNAFLDYYLFGEQVLAIQPIKTENLEVIYFEN